MPSYFLPSLHIQHRLPVADCCCRRSIISFPEKFLFIREYVTSQRYEVFLNVLWTFSDVPPPLNYDSFHFPPWILTPMWSSSHPLPSHLFAFKDIAKSATRFLVFSVKNSPESAWNHAHAYSLPCFIATSPSPQQNPWSNRNTWPSWTHCKGLLVFAVLCPRPWQPDDSPGVIRLLSCPLRASVHFNRLRSCHGEMGSQRGCCVGRSCFRPEDQHLICHSLTIWS